MVLEAADGAFQVQLPDNLAARVRQAKLRRSTWASAPCTWKSCPLAADNGQVALARQVMTYEDLGEEGQLAVPWASTQVLVVTAPRCSWRAATRQR